MSAATLQPAREVCEHLGIEPTPRLLVASVADQRLAEYRQVAGWEFIEERRLVISTSRYGIGQAEDSHKTPPGLPCLAEKNGRHSPARSLFRRRETVCPVPQFAAAPSAPRH